MRPYELVPAPVLSAVLYERCSPRGENGSVDSALSARRRAPELESDASPQTRDGQHKAIGRDL